MSLELKECLEIMRDLWRRLEQHPGESKAAALIALGVLRRPLRSHCPCCEYVVPTPGEFSITENCYKCPALALWTGNELHDVRDGAPCEASWVSPYKIWKSGQRTAAAKEIADWAEAELKRLFPLRPLRKNQKDLLKALERGSWSRLNRGIWAFETPSRVERVLDTLVARGLVTKDEKGEYRLWQKLQ